ncbi:allophanate hydrolase subunit 1 [Rathayibacter sp. ZW T2_19]|uniref:Allophanate hydrolase subunit 1 n=1 Tax=Rathayibacter rubneri TaxID=2950106 RepID=A0A9X2DUR3_9MICO|nr:allophanate hydrolase subunit 1 [Rathayibacter rubneri]MCM6761435.1 allophanate hydrolase subunit 1 [Rathayibacter rubneri]
MIQARLLPSGDRGVLVELEGLDAALALASALERSRPTGVVDLVPAARTVLVVLDPDVLTPAEASRWVRATAAVASTDRAAAAGRVHTLDVRYDGADLESTAAILGWSAAELVRRHTTTAWRAAFGGFAPGFAYLVPLGEWPDVPRRAEPRTGVPTGSVAVAGRYSGIYPRSSPGGWQLLGSTAAALWDVERAPAALLAPGDEIRFREAP